MLPFPAGRVVDPVARLPDDVASGHGVSRQASQATQANAPEQPIAADSAARRKLADLAAVVPGARFELRYATSNNFTGAVLPGYGAARPLLRREAAVALANVERDLESKGMGLKVWDGYRPVRATLGMVAWCERNHRTDLLDSGIHRAAVAPQPGRGHRSHGG